MKRLLSLLLTLASFTAMADSKDWAGDLREHAEDIHQRVARKGKGLSRETVEAVAELFHASIELERAMGGKDNADARREAFERVRCAYEDVRDNHLEQFKSMHRIPHHWRELTEEYGRLLKIFPAEG